MAGEFTWTLRVTTGVGGTGAFRFYPGGELRGEYDPGLTRFGVEFMDAIRHKVILGMQGIGREAQARVANLSRVETGLMQRSVRSQTDVLTDLVRTGFGWENDSPFYAKFQEFGTSSPGRGITPMLAVSAAFEEAEKQLEQLLDRGL
jgi:hypothetical protein